jgi:chaperonin GroEL
LAATLDGDERQGAQILARGLEEPFRQIVHNRGATTPAAALAALQHSGDGHLYDAMTNRVVGVAEAGLLDPAGVLRVALETAASGAMLALTVAVIVLHRKPEQSIEP